MNQLLRTKPLADFTAGAHEKDGLKRVLTSWMLVALGIGAIIGTGIFVLTGTAAANHAGPALVLSFVLAGIGCAFAGLCYAEFAAMIPVSGSAYSYSYATLGEGVAWFIGWNLILEYLFAASTVAVGWSGYLISFLHQIGIDLPAHLVNAPFGKLADGHIGATGALVNFPAVAIVLLIGSLCYVGIQQSAWVNNLVVAIKVTVILLFIAFGLNYVSPENWTPFIPEQARDAAGNLIDGRFGWGGVATGAAVIFFAYIGFDAVSTAAQEAKNPQRDMPIGILGSLVACTILYIIVALIMTGMVNYTELNVAAPVALALDKHPALAWLAIPVKIGAIAGMTSVMLVMMLGQPRIFFAMSRDGLLPKVMGQVHPKHGTPHVSTVITTVLAAVIAGLLPVDVLGELVSIGTLLAFVTVCVGVLVLRKTRPELARPFRVPFPAFTCTAGALVCGYLMYALPNDTWIRLALWTAAGIAVYFVYGKKNSRLRQAA